MFNAEFVLLITLWSLCSAVSADQSLGKVANGIAPAQMSDAFQLAPRKPKFGMTPDEEAAFACAEIEDAKRMAKKHARDHVVATDVLKKAAGAVVVANATLEAATRELRKVSDAYEAAKSVSALALIEKGELDTALLQAQAAFNAGKVKNDADTQRANDSAVRSAQSAVAVAETALKTSQRAEETARLKVEEVAVKLVIARAAAGRAQIEMRIAQAELRVVDTAVRNSKTFVDWNATFCTPSSTDKDDLSFVQSIHSEQKGMVDDSCACTTHFLFVLFFLTTAYMIFY